MGHKVALSFEDGVTKVVKGGKNLTKRRDNKTDPSGLGMYPNYAWTWPGRPISCWSPGRP